MKYVLEVELETTVPSLVSDSEATSSVITAFPTAPIQSRPAAAVSQSNDNEDPWTTLSQVLFSDRFLKVACVLPKPGNDRLPPN